ncbi:hypothetical protein RRG08_046647 [Elysia crispata]|uniref:Uncharacterized protein n=1 Tax=Elysia crispata TaxID=231223 RepID=A0AAE1AQZ8_9GAST|nr:hypothetical protein RRG08_046647 [Elysia crispata]
MIGSPHFNEVVMVSIAGPSNRRISLRRCSFMRADLFILFIHIRWRHGPSRSARTATSLLCVIISPDWTWTPSRGQHDFKYKQNTTT